MPLAQADLLSLLDTYVPREFAQNMVERAFARCGIEGLTATDADVDRVLDAVQIGINLFVEPARQRALQTELQRVVGAAPESYTSHVTVSSSLDVVNARSEGRRIASRLGARGLITQRISSVLSELGQNILLHARRGEIEIRGQRSEPRTTYITARDEGPGIADLQSILADSRPRGYGLGLGGIKATVDRFDVQTSVRGTRVEVQIFV